MNQNAAPLQLGRYVAYVRAQDRPGSLTALAEVVSSRGLSMDSLATGDVRDGTAVVILSFTASERLARLVERRGLRGAAGAIDGRRWRGALAHRRC